MANERAASNVISGGQSSSSNTAAWQQIKRLEPFPSSFDVYHPYTVMPSLSGCWKSSTYHHTRLHDVKSSFLFTAVLWRGCAYVLPILRVYPLALDSFVRFFIGVRPEVQGQMSACVGGYSEQNGAEMQDLLYLNAEQAAKWANVGVGYVYDCLNSADPPPHLKVGKKRLIQAEAWPGYLEKRQEVRA